MICLLISKADAFFSPDKMFVKNVNLEHGLSQCTVTDMAIDSKGFVWIGTFDGLNRFNGSNLWVFKHIPNDKTSLPSSKILKLFSDGNDHLWIRTANGFCIFDTHTGKVVTPDFLKTSIVTWVCKNDKNSVWLYARSKGLMLINTTDFSSRLYENRDNRIPLTCDIIDLYKVGTDVFIVSSCGDIVRFEIPNRTFRIIKNTVSTGTLYDNSGIDKYGHIFLISPQADMVSFDTRLLQFHPTTYYNQNDKLISVRSMQYDATNNILLLGTYGQGLFIYDYGSESLKQYKKNGDDIALSGNYIQRSISDNNGVIYIGYDGAGVDVLDPFIKKFTTICKYDSDDLKNLRFVRKIIEDDRHNLLIGTGGSGLVKYNRLDHSFSFYNSGNVLTNSDNFIIDMIRINNELWLGYNGCGIDVLDINTLTKIRHISAGNSEKEISNGVIWSFLNDSLGNLWVGTRLNGMNKINLISGKVQQFNKTEYPMLSSGMRCLSLLKNGNILLGTENGLFEIDVMSSKFNLVFPRRPEDETIKSFKCIYVDPQDRIWLGTDGMGILILDKKYTKLNNLNSANSLNSDVVYGILPENDSTIWISSNAGLSTIHWKGQKFNNDSQMQTVNYDEKNGLQSNEFNTGAYTLLKDGNMAFGGLNGINVFRPQDIKNSSMVPIVFINEFKVFENQLKTDTLIPYMSSVHLKNFENSFSITFGTIGYSIKGKTKYKYRLVGYDMDWINADGRNYVSYTNMKSGNYEFQVKACSYDGVWNENYTSLLIIIATPFYRSWWFILLLVGFMSEGGYLLYRNRMRQSKEREHLKITHTREIAEVEMKALRAQINPHFLFNSLNSINSYILRNDNKTASRYLVKFSQLVRSILNNSSSPFITLKEELNTIELYMHIEGMRFNNQFSYLIDVTADINASEMMIPSLLLQPYVENAIWHGLLHKEGEKNISIKVNMPSSETVCIQIEDNGVGRKMAAEMENKPDHRKSFGMELGESRLKLMNDGHEIISSVQVIDKMDNQQNPCGTLIKIIIPGRKQHQKENN